MRVSVAIIGSGFSGTLTAIHVLQSPSAEHQIDLYLIDVRGSFGPGLAYSPPSERFKLNVPAGAMGAFADDPEGFYRWLRERDIAISPDDFAPRVLYGRYLSDLLEQASARSNNHTLHRIHDEVVDIFREHGTDSWKLTFKSGRTIAADACILAMGNLMRTSTSAREPASHFRQPFESKSYEDISSHENIFLLGSSLTAVDVIMECEARGFRGTYTVLSRHGRFPLPYIERSTVKPADLPPTWDTRGSVRELVSTVRAESHRLGSSQPVFEAMRPKIQSMWRHFSLGERRRFLRHVRPIWDIHRHRIPAEHADILTRLQLERRLHILAGRLRDTRDHEGRLSITINRRGAPQPITLQPPFDLAFQCTGPEGDIIKINHPLLQTLAAQHLIEPGPLGLGPVRNDLDRLPLWLMGPLRREDLWETTAVREIRQQAREVAGEVCNLLSKATTPHKQ